MDNVEITIIKSTQLNYVCVYDLVIKILKLNKQKQ